MPGKKLPLSIRIIIRILLTVLTLALVAAFYLGVILGQPQESQEEAVDLHQPLTQPAPKQTITAEAMLPELITAFPVEVLCAPGSSGYVLEQGDSYDVAFEGGVARMIRLQYVTPDGFVLVVDSVYPARALETLQGGGFHLMAQEGSPMAGMRTVRMENGETVRLHCQSATGLYAVTLPMAAASQLTSLVRPLQLIGAEGL